MLYQQLTDFLLTKLPLAYQAKLTSNITQGEIVNNGRNVTEKGIELFHFPYSAVFYFDEFPYREISTADLMAWIQIWLLENDLNRSDLELSNPKMEIEILDDATAIIAFDIEFYEPIEAIEEVNGNLEFENKKYRLAQIEIAVAEQVSEVVNVVDD